MPATLHAIPEAMESSVATRDKADRVVSCFQTIYQQRMADIPVINEKIEVSAVGFQHWQNSILGILITPWFMNLILLPGESENWDEYELLSKQSYSFPSGRYTFITGYEEAIGKFQMCSLFSPMFEFADNNSAVETAEIAIRELLNKENIEQIDEEANTIESIWNGEDANSDNSLSEAAESLTESEKEELLEAPSLAEKLQQPISRRELFRAAFRQDKDRS
jgi:[NiFe] hydrogenase assembly HybE family chaperone